MNIGDLAFLEVWALKDNLFAQQGVYSADATFHSPTLNQAVELTDISPD
jgi:hypothetical protein